jgi:hypothetical protein
VTFRVFLVVTLPRQGWVDGCQRTHRSCCPSRDLSVARRRSAGGGVDVLHRARDLAQVVLRAAQASPGRRPGGVLEPRSRRPKSSPSKLTDDVKAQAIAVRAALEASGLDHGPISVHDKMTSMGLPVVPSTAALARIFREAGVARLEPKKKPRAAWRRFVYPAPNACWQLDATEYVLTGGRKCVIFKLIDDHSRYAVASHVAWVRPPRPRSPWWTRASPLTGYPNGS